MPLPDCFKSIDALLGELGTSRRQFFGFLNNRKDDLYLEFDVRGKNGKVRRISSPHFYLKHLQRKLAVHLDDLYRPTNVAHGFVRTRSIVTNAMIHRKQRVVLNLDLKDFFPTITNRRIEALLASRRYGLPRHVARFIAKICTHEGSLPQGAPTSPVLSNMICSRMDSRLRELAKTAKCRYTRYADDITFSTSLIDFPEKILRSSAPVALSYDLLNIVSTEGFCVNEKKTRLAAKNSRQTVTGLTVNAFPNVPRSQIDELRAILHDWGRHGEDKATAKFLKCHPWKEDKPGTLRRYVFGQLAFFSMVRGNVDPIVIRLSDSLKKNLDPNFAVTREDLLRVSLAQFKEVELESDTNKAGLMLESAFSKFAQADGMLVKEAFRCVKGAIQVDGAIQYQGNDYWVECKWWKKRLSTTQVQSFAGKLQAAPNGTRGVLVSKSGFSKDVEKTLNIYNNIILVSYSSIINYAEGGGGLRALVEDSWNKNVTS